MELRNYLKPGVSLYNYQTETPIFLATKHEKTNMACSYLNFKYFLHFASTKYFLQLLASDTTKMKALKMTWSGNTSDICRFFFREREIPNIWGGCTENT